MAKVLVVEEVNGNKNRAGAQARNYPSSLRHDALCLTSSMTRRWIQEYSSICKTVFNIDEGIRRRW